MTTTKRLPWLVVLAFCAVCKFLIEWLEEHARKRVRGEEPQKEW